MTVRPETSSRAPTNPASPSKALSCKSCAKTGREATGTPKVVFFVASQTKVRASKPHIAHLWTCQSESQKERTHLGPLGNDVIHFCLSNLACHLCFDADALYNGISCIHQPGVHESSSCPHCPPLTTYFAPSPSSQSWEQMPLPRFTA